MWMNDPFELTQAPVIKEAEELFTEPRDYHEFFWDEAIERGHHVQSNKRLHTQVCRFDEYGDHTVMARDCPHFNSDDEEGNIIRKGWTVQ